MMDKERLSRLDCGCIYIGDFWHTQCARCLRERNDARRRVTLAEQRRKERIAWMWDGLALLLLIGVFVFTWVAA
jgi:hypothetical protein